MITFRDFMRLFVAAVCIISKYLTPPNQPQSTQKNQSQQNQQCKNKPFSIIENPLRTRSLEMLFCLILTREFETYFWYFLGIFFSFFLEISKISFNTIMKFRRPPRFSTFERISIERGYQTCASFIEWRKQL